MLKPYDRAADVNIKAVQDRVALYLSKLTNQPGHDTVKYDNVLLTAGVQNCLEHGLRREWVGYRVVSNDVGAVVFDDPTATQDKSLYAVLGCDISCVVSLEVF